MLQRVGSTGTVCVDHAWSWIHFLGPFMCRTGREFWSWCISPVSGLSAIGVGPLNTARNARGISQSFSQGFAQELSRGRRAARPEFASRGLSFRTQILDTRPWPWKAQPMTLLMHPHVFSLRRGFANSGFLTRACSGLPVSVYKWEVFCLPPPAPSSFLPPIAHFHLSVQGTLIQLDTTSAAT